MLTRRIEKTRRRLIGANEISRYLNRILKTFQTVSSTEQKIGVASIEMTVTGRRRLKKSHNISSLGQQNIGSKSFNKKDLHT